MTTAAELAFSEQFGHLQEIATAKKWDLDKRDETSFVLRLPARDGSHFWLLAECERFPTMPPIWHWYNPETKALDQLCDTPKGGNFFHGSGRICAPWNRLAYKQCHPQGPHGDWELANWMTNPKTGGTTTLAAMVLRIYAELQSPNFQGQMG